MYYVTMCGEWSGIFFGLCVQQKGKCNVNLRCDSSSHSAISDVTVITALLWLPHGTVSSTGHSDPLADELSDEQVKKMLLCVCSQIQVMRVNTDNRRTLCALPNIYSDYVQYFITRYNN